MNQAPHIQVDICHSIQGRLRLRSSVLQNARTLSQQLQSRLITHPHIKSAQVRHLTGSIILHYDTNRAGPDRLFDLVIRTLEPIQINVPANSVHLKPRDNEQPVKPSRQSPASPLTLYLANAVTLTGYVVYALAKRFLFRSPVSSHGLSMTGLVAVVGAIPLFIRAWRDVRQAKRTGLFPFLAAACILAILVGEALAAFEIIWILSIGLVLEEYVTERARKAIREILEVSPEKSFVLVGTEEKEIPTIQIQTGDTIVVRPHRKIPVDGVVLKGEALVDEATITGRAQPELHGTEDWVYAGTRVQQGFLHIRADNLGEQTYLSGILRLVEASLSEQTEMEKKADVLAARLTRMAIAATLASLVLSRSLTRSFSVMLVLACPCATVLAASTAISAAIANAASRQIFIKGGRYLEAIPSIDHFCFDKTGTITTDVPEVIGVISYTSEQEPLNILQIAASAESMSEHPLAKALLNEVRRKGLDLLDVVNPEEVVGLGTRAKRGNDIIRVGSSRFMEIEKVHIACTDDNTEQHIKSGHTVLFVALNNDIQGVIALANTVRPGAEHVLERLKNDGPVSFSLISGDTEPVVRAISESLDFDQYQATFLPEEKARYIERLEADNHNVLMVGDGVNDALALARATVGVAMGAGGSQVAFEAADIILVKDDLSGLVTLGTLSRQAMRIIEQNFWMANFTNIFGIILGFLGHLPPVLAGLLHVSHTLGIMANSGRLLRARTKITSQD